MPPLDQFTEPPFFRVNNFRFQAEGSFQKMCPFAAHVRKTNPRADLEDRGISIEKNRITRRGVQFGPELTEAEKLANKTLHGRARANNPTFPPGAAPAIPGYVGPQGVRTMSGTDPNTPATNLTAPQFIDSRGGEYFFSPSLKGLRETLATA
ncbi:hypothetical protein H0H92_015422 [Tricholoma furcatifolium]|nr:hypothetical protein H0H92_015422 [Tricholoma furcatifolium]